MKEPNLKKFPSFGTDQEAEDFVDNADLSEYDFSGFKTVKYEFEPKVRQKKCDNKLPKHCRKQSAATGNVCMDWQQSCGEALQDFAPGR